MSSRFGGTAAEHVHLPLLLNSRRGVEFLRWKRYRTRRFQREALMPGPGFYRREPKWWSAWNLAIV